MSRPARMTKTEMLEKLTHVFRASGFSGANLTTLAATTGLSKASLYHHFPRGKLEMVELVLAQEGKRLQKLVLAPVAGSNSGSGDLIKSLENVAVLYGGTVPACLMNSVLIGDQAELFRAAISATVSAWRRAYALIFSDLTGSAEEGEAWAQYALERIQGALVMCRVTASRGPLEVCIAELKGDVLAYV